MRQPLLPALLFGLLLCGHGARAQVLAIGDQGNVVVLSGPAVTTRDGVTPLPTAAVPAVAVATDARVEREIAAAAARFGVDGRLARAVAVQESGLRQEARSPKGALGVMQLTPVTARALGVDPADLAGNVHGGVAYLAQMLRRYDGDVRLALAAYNAGPTAVARHGGVPPFLETQSYVRGVLARVASITFAPPALGAPP